MNIRAIMQAKYPEADFGEYFRFLVSCAGTPKRLTHEHHIAPRKQFPELADEPENQVTLTILDHAFAHKLLRAAHLDFRSNADAWIAATVVFTAAHSERSSRWMKKLNSDPAFAENRRAIFKKLHATSVFAAAHAARHRKRMEKLNTDPVFVAARNTRTSAMHRDPVFLAAQTERLHIRWHVNRNQVNKECVLCSKSTRHTLV